MYAFLMTHCGGGGGGGVPASSTSSSPPTSQWHAALRAAAGQISFFTPRANEQTPPRRIPSRASRHCSHGHLRAGFLTRRAPKRRNTIAFLECRGFLRNRLLAHGKSASRRLAATKAPDYILPFEVEVGGPESRAKTSASAVTCTLFCRIARLPSGRLHIESCLQPVSCSVDCCRLPPPSSPFPFPSAAAADDDDVRPPVNFFMNSSSSSSSVAAVSWWPRKRHL